MGVRALNWPQSSRLTADLGGRIDERTTTISQY